MPATTTAPSPTAVEIDEIDYVSDVFGRCVVRFEYRPATGSVYAVCRREDDGATILERRLRGANVADAITHPALYLEAQLAAQKR
jgi:hypothetical protein